MPSRARSPQRRRLPSPASNARSRKVSATICARNWNSKQNIRHARSNRAMRRKGCARSSKSARRNSRGSDFAQSHPFVDLRSARKDQIADQRQYDAGDAIDQVMPSSNYRCEQDDQREDAEEELPGNADSSHREKDESRECVVQTRK